MHGAQLLQKLIDVVLVEHGPQRHLIHDVSSRHATDVALRYQAALVNHVSDAIIGTTRTGVITSWNPAAEAI